VTCDLTNPIFTDEEEARKHFEALRWPDGPECPFCGLVNDAHELQGVSKVAKRDRHMIAGMMLRCGPKQRLLHRFRCPLPSYADLHY
jgi:hypothetical protein